MIESETHRQNLINIAEKIESKYKRNPIDGKGNPTETYLEYLSLMYNSEISEMVQHLEVFPTTTTVTLSMATPPNQFIM